MYRKGVAGKMLKLKEQKGKHGYCYPVMYKKHNDKRYKEHRVFISYIIATYIFNLKENEYIRYKDGNIYNNDINNLEIRSFDENCRWDRLKGYENDYVISDKGEIISLNRKQLLSAITTQGGYKHVSICSQKHRLHYLVYTTFNKNFIKKENYVIDHIDNNPSNNSYDNLQYIHSVDNVSKDHKSKSGLPTGVECKNDVYRAFVTYTLDNVHYTHVWLGNFNNAEQASQCYKNALKKIRGGENPIIYYTKNSKIRYCFGNNKWFYNENRNTISKNNITYYDTPEEIEMKLSAKESIPLLNKEILNLSKRIDSLSKEIKNGKNSQIKYEILLKDKENIIQELKSKNSELKHENKKFKIYNNGMSSELAVYKEKIKIQEQTNKEKQRDFVYKENYTANKYNDNYTFNIPYSDGRRYYFGSFSDPAIVRELDDIFNEHKFENDFVEWFEGFKKTKLDFYKEKDKPYRMKKYNQSLGYKGYKWFAPRNCWRVIKRMNNKEYSLGYYKNEDSCKAILNEANQMIELGKFEEWYKNIEEHKYKIKVLFDEFESNKCKRRSTKDGFAKKKNTTTDTYY